MTLRRAIPLVLVALALVCLVLLASASVPVVSALAGATAIFLALVVLAWASWRLFRVFLWRVGRRLAFSYFLLGVLPIPMVLLLLLLAAYIQAGFFLGHLYRDAVISLEEELDEEAEDRLAAFAREGRPGPAAEGPVAFAYYRDGRRVGGDARAPERWERVRLEGTGEEADGGPVRLGRDGGGPQAGAETGGPAGEAALDETPGAGAGGAEDEDLPDASRHSFRGLPSGAPTIAAVEVRGDPGDGGRAVIAFWDGGVETELSRRADVWVEVQRPDDPVGGGPVRIQVGDRVIPVQPVARKRLAEEADRFFAERAGPDRGGEAVIEAEWVDSPLLWWGELAGPWLPLGGGEAVSDRVPVTLNATPRTVFRHLFSGSAELDAGVWGALLVVAALLANVYLVAALMAGFMIGGLSRAVNRLSRATAAIQAGDFSVRIPSGRRDQVGALQRAFNQMAANLEHLVAEATEKELLEKELSIAAELQRSLIPRDLPQSERLELATLFEPSAAIGGDYFDVLEISRGRLAVVIADVSGHGLPTGLRMAMMKAALGILIAEEKRPEDVLARLDGVVRAEEGRRFFITATLALLDPATGDLEITNAGHCPTYRVGPEGDVEEILLPGSPLGAIGRNYGKRHLRLAPGDSAVWLSDGLIEGTNEAGEPFGYKQVVEALGAGGPVASAEALRDRLLGAVAEHTGGRAPEDDRTLVVLRFLEERGEAGAPSETAPSDETEPTAASDAPGEIQQREREAPVDPQ